MSDFRLLRFEPATRLAQRLDSVSAEAHSAQIRCEAALSEVSLAAPHFPSHGTLEYWAGEIRRRVVVADDASCRLAGLGGSWRSWSAGGASLNLMGAEAWSSGWSYWDGLIGESYLSAGASAYLGRGRVAIDGTEVAGLVGATGAIESEVQVDPMQLTGGLKVEAEAFVGARLEGAASRSWGPLSVTYGATLGYGLGAEAYYRAGVQTGVARLGSGLSAHAGPGGGAFFEVELDLTEIGEASLRVVEAVLDWVSDL